MSLSRYQYGIWHEKASHAELFLSIIMQRVVYRAARSAQAGGRGAPPRTARCAVRHTGTPFDTPLVYGAWTWVT